MRSEKERDAVLRASLLGLLAVVVFGGLLVVLEIGILLAEGRSGEAFARELSVFSRNVTPWVLLAAGVVAGLSLRSLLLIPVLATSALTNVYFFVLSLLFHAFVGGITAALFLVQVQTFLLGLVLFGIGVAVGSVVESEKGRRGIQE